MSAPVGNVRPDRLWSLWDMLKFELDDLVLHLRLMQTTENRLNVYGLTLPDDYAAQQNNKVASDSVESYAKAMDRVRSFCAKWNLPATASAAAYIGTFAGTLTISQLKAAINQLRFTIENDLKAQLIYYMTPDESTHYEIDELGGSFSSNDAKFPSAVYDMREANSCYAVGRYTASVFHSMRVLEYGLRALAKDVGEDASRENWQTVVERIEKKIRITRESMKKGDDKEMRVTFLSEAAKEFFYLKDGWRNHVSHAKAKYDGPQALSAINDVHAFMTHLSTVLRELPDD